MEKQGMIPRFKPNIGASEFCKIFKWSRPDQVEKFEGEFSSLVGHSHGLSFTYGRMALYAYLKAMGISQKEIICPAYTCIVMAHAIEESGNSCVFVDIKKDDLNMNFEKLKEAITEHTAVIIFTSLYGNPVSLEEVDYIKSHYPQIKIIQDCTHIINGKRDTKTIALFGDAAIFGLGLSKPITSIFGGMLTTNDQKVYEKMKELRGNDFFYRPARGLFKRVYLLLAFIAFNKYFYTLTNFLERRGFIDYFVKLFDTEKISLPKDSFQRMSHFEADIGLIQLQRFASIAEHNRKIANIYQKKLQGFFTKIDVHPEGIVSHYNILAKNRATLIDNLLNHGVQLGDMYNYSLPQLPPYSSHQFYHDQNIALEISDQIVNLPLCISEDEAIKVADLINKFG